MVGLDVGIAHQVTINSRLAQAWWTSLSGLNPSSPIPSFHNCLTSANYAGPLLCFIHADSRPPATLVPDIRNMLGDGRIVMGGFRVIIEHKGKKLHWMTFHQLIKTYYAPLLFRPISFFR